MQPTHSTWSRLSWICTLYPYHDKSISDMVVSRNTRGYMLYGIKYYVHESYLLNSRNKMLNTREIITYSVSL